MARPSPREILGARINVWRSDCHGTNAPLQKSVAHFGATGLIDSHECAEVRFYGPFRFLGASSTIDSIPAGVSGVYLWCIKGHDGVYRVHYVGEAVDVRARLRTHRDQQMAGRYTAFDLDQLRSNVKVLAHRPRVGMVGAYRNHDAAEYNARFLAASEIFYADLGSATDKSTRCRYETALCVAIEDHGQNILHVGALRGYSIGSAEVAIFTPEGVHIEGLTNGSLRL